MTLFLKNISSVFFFSLENELKNRLGSHWKTFFNEFLLKISTILLPVAFVNSQLKNAVQQSIISTVHNSYCGYDKKKNSRVAEFDNRR